MLRQSRLDHADHVLLRRLVVAALLPLVFVAGRGKTHGCELDVDHREIAPGLGLFTGLGVSWAIVRRNPPKPGPGTPPASTPAKGAFRHDRRSHACRHQEAR
jgi:hypothetical protein